MTNTDHSESSDQEAQKESEHREHKNKKEKKHAVTLVTSTLLLMVLFLGFSAKPDDSRSQATFEDVVASYSTVSDLRLARVKLLIQQARAFELRSMHSDAAIEYAKARKMLRGSHGRIGSVSNAGTASIIQHSLSYVERAYVRVGGK